MLTRIVSTCTGFMGAMVITVANAKALGAPLHADSIPMPYMQDSFFFHGYVLPRISVLE